MADAPGLLDEVARKGLLSNVNLTPVSEGRWQASARRVGTASWVCCTADTPGEAVREAMAGLLAVDQTHEDLFG